MILEKIIINKIPNNSGIEVILHYLYEFYNVNDNQYMDGVYDYYNLEPPPKSWIKYCKKKKNYYLIKNIYVYLRCLNFLIHHLL